MPPHCDTLDGPVVKAAQLALERGNVNLILPYVPKRAEAELRHAFERALRVRSLSPEAQEAVDYWLFETAVRLHREGEGALFTGLKPAGLDPGPAVPRAEKAVATGRVEEVGGFLCQMVEGQLRQRLHEVVARRDFDGNDVDAARAYVRAMLDFIVYSHSLYTAVLRSAPERAHDTVVAHAGHHH